MGLVRESEVIITKKTDTQIELTDSREKDEITLVIPGVYNVRKETSPVVATLSGATPSTSYYVYATYPTTGTLKKKISGFDILISTDSDLFSGVLYLGAIQTDANGHIMDITVGGEPEQESLLDVPVKVDMGSSFKESDTIELSQIPDTANKAILDVTITSIEDESATIKFFVPGESKHIASVSAPPGETRGEETVRIPIPDVQNTIRYRIDRTPITSKPRSSIYISGWVE